MYRRKSYTDYIDDAMWAIGDGRKVTINETAHYLKNKKRFLKAANITEIEYNRKLDRVRRIIRDYFDMLNDGMYPY